MKYTFVIFCEPKDKLLQCISEGQRKACERRLKYGGEKKNEQTAAGTVHKYLWNSNLCILQPNYLQQTGTRGFVLGYLSKSSGTGRKIDETQNPKSYLISIALRIWKNKKRKFAWRKRMAGDSQLVEEAVSGDVLIGEDRASSPEGNVLAWELGFQYEFNSIAISKRFKTMAV